MAVTRVEGAPAGDLADGFRALVEQLPQGIAVHSDGLILYVNPALARMLGYEPDEVTGRPWRDFVHPHDLEAAARNVEKASRVLGEAAMGAAERRLIGKQGGVLTVELVAVPLVFEGRPSLLVVAHDLTRRKRLEDQLRQADHMAAVGRLAAGVAHEINNPLAYVLANLSYAKEQLGAAARAGAGRTDSSVVEAIIEAHQGVERMRQVVSDLKTFTRRDEGEVDLLNLVTVVESMLKMAHAEIRHSARVERSYGPAPRVKANQTKLAQVFLNLLVNAAQAIPEGRASENAVLVCVGTDERGNAVVEVRDTGVGIPEANLSRVTEPFFTTKPVGVGTGLGLSVCRNIVEGYMGRLSIESVVGWGTNVRVTLPPAPVGFARRASSVKLHAVRLQRYRVLIVDDDPMVLRSYQRVLRNHEIQTATSGREALEILARNPEFDVILCDLMMPELTGMDVYDRLREGGHGLERRIVFLSGGIFTERARSFLETVPNLRFEKPLDPERLQAVLAAGAEMPHFPES
jgi:two-component system cell cycle sensor histidine kinase/response regulator CckA